MRRVAEEAGRFRTGVFFRTFDLFAEVLFFLTEVPFFRVGAAFRTAGRGADDGFRAAAELVRELTPAASTSSEVLKTKTAARKAAGMTDALRTLGLSGSR